MSTHQETHAVVNLAALHRHHEAQLRQALTAGDDAAAQRRMCQASQALGKVLEACPNSPEARVLAMLAKITGLRINLSNDDYSDTWENWDGRDEPYELVADLSADLLDLARMLGVEGEAIEIQKRPVAFAGDPGSPRSID
jgi:hypothetical protein